MSSVSDAIARFMLAVDDHDWDGVTTALGETVRRDYTSLFGGDRGSPWVVGGTYRFALRHADGRWRIVAITLDTRWQTSDAGVLRRAATPSPARR